MIVVSVDRWSLYKVNHRSVYSGLCRQVAFIERFKNTYAQGGVGLGGQTGELGSSQKGVIIL